MTSDLYFTATSWFPRKCPRKTDLKSTVFATQTYEPDTLIVCANCFLSVIVDADPSGNTCHKALFNIGGTTTTSRSWDIKITQYSCGDYDSSGYEFSLYHIQSKKNKNIYNIQQ